MLLRSLLLAPFLHGEIHFYITYQTTALPDLFFLTHGVCEEVLYECGQLYSVQEIGFKKNKQKNNKQTRIHGGMEEWRRKTKMGIE